MNIQEKVIKIILQGARNKNVIVEDVRKIRLVEDLGYDSVGLIGLFMQMEEEFEFEIEDVDLINAMSIEHLINICLNSAEK